MTRLLTDAQVADLLGVKPLTIRRMRADGRLPYVKSTGLRAVRIREDDVLALIKRNTKRAGAPAAATHGGGVDAA